MQYWSALEEWQSSHFIKKQFEAKQCSKTYVNIRDHITDHLKNNLHADDALERLGSWAADLYASPSSPPLN